MSRETEKMFSQITKMIEEKGLTTEEEIKNFMENEVVGKSLFDSDDEEDISDEDFAKDLVNEAIHCNDEFKAITLIETALDHDKNCIEAYLYLATTQKHHFLIIHFLKIANKIGNKKFPKAYLQENKEHLWYIHETRPFLRAMYGLGEMYFMDENFYDAIKILKKLINLCPDDNLGVRDILLSSFLWTEEYEDFDHYQKIFSEDQTGIALFNNVFYSYYNDSDKEKTTYLLKAAQKANTHTVKKLIYTNIKLKSLNGNRYAVGSPEEANTYCVYMRELWQDDDNLINWLKQNQ